MFTKCSYATGVAGVNRSVVKWVMPPSERDLLCGEASDASGNGPAKERETQHWVSGRDPVWALSRAAVPWYAETVLIAARVRNPGELRAGLQVYGVHSTAARSVPLAGGVVDQPVSWCGYCLRVASRISNDRRRKTGTCCPVPVPAALCRSYCLGCKTSLNRFGFYTWGRGCKLLPGEILRFPKGDNGGQLSPHGSVLTYFSTAGSSHCCGEHPCHFCQAAGR